MDKALTFRRGGSGESATADDARAFLQRRTARFGLVVGTLLLLYLGLRLAAAFAAGYGHILSQAALHASLTGAAGLLLIWVILRRGRRSVFFVQAVDSLGLLLVSACFLVMGGYLPLVIQPAMTVLLLLSVLFFSRAVFVPSTAWRTGALGTVVGLALIAWTWWIYARGDLAWLALVDEALLEVDREWMAGFAAAFTGLWWIITVLLTALASQVVYGLRTEARRGRRLGQYTLLQKLGEGGMGAVYRARHALLRRPTAVKLLRPDKAGEEAVERFEREVQFSSQLTHPNTVTIFDFGRTPGGIFYYAMELLDGPTLAQVVQVSGPQSPARVVRILRQVAGALGEAHRAGLIHRDVKPGNVILLQRAGLGDLAKVVDFGLVKNLDAGAASALTRADAITGTPQYMPPEAITAPESLDARGDIYALGAVGYFLVTGRHVFEGATIVEICSHHLTTPPTPPSERLGREVPATLERLLLAMLDKDRAARPQSAAEVELWLRRCVDDCGVWHTEDAERWWNEYGPDLAREEAPETPTGHTLEVDLGLRSTPPF